MCSDYSVVSNDFTHQFTFNKNTTLKKLVFSFKTSKVINCKHSLQYFVSFVFC